MQPPVPEDSDLHRILDAIPSPLLLTDADVRVLHGNRAAREGLGVDLEQADGRRSGDLFHCIFARDSQAGCGTTEFCPACVLRNSVREASAGRPVVQRTAHMILGNGERSEDRWFSVSASPLRMGARELVLLELRDVTPLVELADALPFCVGCGRMRDGADPAEVWSQAGAVLRKQAGFPLGDELCADCRRRLAAPGARDAGGKAEA